VFEIQTPRPAPPSWPTGREKPTKKNQFGSAFGLGSASAKPKFFGVGTEH